MAYCILNIKTYHSISDLKGIQAEALRTYNCSNVDSNRTTNNEIVLGDMDYCGALKRCLGSKYYTETDKYGRTHKPPQVCAIGFVLTFSPEAQGTFNEREWINMNIEFLQDKFKGCPISAIVHRDESTTHIQGVIIPFKDGKINKSAFLRGKADLVQLQDDYALKMQIFGLVRGVPSQDRNRRENIIARQCNHIFDER